MTLGCSTRSNIFPPLWFCHIPLTHALNQEPGLSACSGPRIVRYLVSYPNLCKVVSYVVHVRNYSHPGAFIWIIRRSFEAPVARRGAGLSAHLIPKQKSFRMADELVDGAGNRQRPLLPTHDFSLETGVSFERAPEHDASEFCSIEFARLHIQGFVYRQWYRCSFDERMVSTWRVLLSLRAVALLLPVLLEFFPR